jgi:hypothetical protein
MIHRHFTDEEERLLQGWMRGDFRVPGNPTFRLLLVRFAAAGLCGVILFACVIAVGRWVTHV